MADPLDDLKYERLLRTRAITSKAIGHAARQRRRRSLLTEGGGLFLVAADHPARGQLGVGDDPGAMTSRRELLRRLLVALDRPGVDGVLGTADVLEDLLLLGALEDRIAIGSMNRGGLQHSVFELDDRFTACTVEGIVSSGFDGGKMLCRIDDRDYGTARTLESCGGAVSALAEHGLVAMVEPLPVERSDGALRLVRDTDRVARAIAIASGLGSTSAYTWLKVPVVPEMTKVMAATTLPSVILGGDVPSGGGGPDAEWSTALTIGNVRGIVAGRRLLYPPDGDVANAVDGAASLLAQALAARSVNGLRDVGVGAEVDVRTDGLSAGAAS